MYRSPSVVHEDRSLVDDRGKLDGPVHDTTPACPGGATVDEQDLTGNGAEEHAVAHGRRCGPEGAVEGELGCRARRGQWNAPEITAERRRVGRVSRDCHSPENRSIDVELPLQLEGGGIESRDQPIG